MEDSSLYQNSPFQYESTSPEARDVHRYGGAVSVSEGISGDVSSDRYGGDLESEDSPGTAEDSLGVARRMPQLGGD